MSIVKKAVVLAAGMGTRLRPFTCAVPKPLMPVWGETMLSRMVTLLRDRGVTDIVVNAHHLHAQIEAWCAANNCRVSYEPEILGNGGVLNPLRDWIGDEPFYLANADIVVENVPNLEKAFAQAGEDVLGVCAVTAFGPRTIEVEPEYGYVTNWKSEDSGCSGTYTYAGLAILKPEILAFVKEKGFSSIISAYEAAMMTGKFMKTVASDEFLWEDAGTVSRYIELNSSEGENAFAAIPQLKAAAEALGVSGSEAVEFLGARGSDRVFFRLGGEIAIVYDDGNRSENALYAEDARYLKKQGISVPEVLFDSPELKTLVLSNAGIERKMSFEDYTKVIVALARFNALGVRPDLPKMLPAFDHKLWAWERDLFAEHCLRSRFQMEMPENVRKELEGVAAALEKEPTALVHRDFQSTNILWKGSDLSFIDFQGMRLGPAAYDVASLVYDPYVSMTEKRREALVALYAKEVGRPDFDRILPLAAVQRLIQCLGAYGRLASVGQPQFGKYVMPALENLLEAADLAGLEAVGALAEDLIAKEGHLGHSHHHCDA